MNEYKCPKCGFIYDDEKENILFTDLDDNYFCPFCLTPKKEFTLEEEQPKKEVNLSLDDYDDDDFFDDFFDE